MKTKGLYLGLSLQASMLLAWMNGMAGNTMTISSHTVNAEEIFTVNVSVANDSSFVAFQFDIAVPSGFSFISGSAILDPFRSNGHLLEAQLLQGSTLRILSYSQENLPYSGNSGTVLSFQLKAGTAPGTYALNLATPVIGDSASVNLITGSTNGTATVLAPNVYIAQSSLDFGRTPLEQTSGRSLTIYNTGNQPLNINNITFNSEYFTIPGTSSFVIPSNQNTAITIVFNSQIKGTYDRTMTIHSDDPDAAEVNVSLHAIAYAVNELHCGNMTGRSGNPASLTFSVNNMEPFTGFQFDLALPTVLSYTPGSVELTGRKTDHVISAEVITGNKLRVVCYSPSQEAFTGNSGSILETVFIIKGIGGSYPLNLLNVIITDSTGENTLSDTFNGTLQVAAGDIHSVSSIDFGSVSILDNGQNPLRIYNYGTDTLKIEQIQCSPSCFTSNDSGPVNILQSEFLDIDLQFHANSEGDYTGSVKIISNDPDEYHFFVNLQANAFVPNYIIIPSLAAKPQDTIKVPVKVENYEPFTGFQFDILLPAILSYIPESAVLSDRSSNQLVTAEIVPGNKLRVISYSITNAAFTGDTGTVLTLDLAVNAQNNEESIALQLSNAFLANSLEENILWGTEVGSISIIHAHPLMGTLTYNNAANTPLNSVNIFLWKNNEKVDSTLTNTNGSFTFPEMFQGSYYFTAQTQNSWGGVNGTDALKVLMHFANLSQITVPIRLTGADVNNSNYINATDALGINRRFVELDTAFAISDWLFENQAGGNVINMPNNNYSVQLYGLCAGDVNGSFIPSGAVDKNSAGIEIDASKSMKVMPGEEVFIPVSLPQDLQAGAISLTLSYPQEYLTVSEVIINQGTLLFCSRPGKLNISRVDLNPIQLFANLPFIYIKAKISDNFSPGDRIEIENANYLSELSNRNGDPLEGIVVSIPSIIYSENIKKEELILFPNPARNYTSLNMMSAEDGSADIRVESLNGIILQKIENKPIKSGNNLIQIVLCELSPGEYLVKVEFSSQMNRLSRILKLIVY